MRRILDVVLEEFGAFLDQRENAALCVRCADDETIVVGKVIEELEDSRLSEMFWAAGAPFGDAVSWVSAVVDGFATQQGAVALAMKEQGMEPWPPVPDAVLDAHRPPAERLRELIIFSRSLLPDPDGMRVVWVLMPAEIHNAQGWALLMRDVLRHTFPRPWFQQVRMFVRAERATNALDVALAETERIAWSNPELSQDAFVRAIEAEASDPAVPLAQRLQNVFLSANVDYAHKRYPDAMRKYYLLLRYYLGVRDGAMTALVLNGMGEVHERVGHMAQAANCYQAAMEPALGAPGPPVPILLNTSLNMANLRLAERNWPEAEGWYDNAQKLATLQRAPDTKLRAMENLALCQYMQGKVDDAIVTWHAGAAVAGELEMPAIRQSMLQRLHMAYGYLQDQAKQRTVANELLRMGAAPD